MTPDWSTQKLPEVFDALRTTEHGLGAEEARRRLAEDGPNALPEAKSDGALVIFLRQFESPLIYLLFAACAIVLLMGELANGLIILAVLLFNAVVGAIQEGRAARTLHALKAYAEASATVVRDGEDFIIPDREVVRGDVVALREGEKVPADARIVAASGLKTDEASLTGESEPVEKVAETLPSVASALEARNMVFKGTSVVAGRGSAVVVATGAKTAIGAIAVEISALDAEMPLKANIRYLSRVIIVAVGVMSVGLFALGILKGEDAVTIFSTVVSLAVSVIPEGLPIVLTLVLATGVWRMSKLKVLVKKLQAVEALGQARIIAVDKTGTLTKNELVIREVFTEGKLFRIGGVGYEPKGTVELYGAAVDAANHPELLFAGKMATLCSNAQVSFSKEENRWRVMGDPTEAAMQVFGEKVGFNKDDLSREAAFLSEIPFDYRLKYHATLHELEGRRLLVVEGAPETILALSSRIRHGGEDRSLDAQTREELEAALAKMSGRGLRVVAGAVRELSSAAIAPESVRDLVFVSFFGMQDALRPEVAGAMERAMAAGVKVVMITGDHKLTATTIAKEAGIWKEGHEVLTGAMVEEMSEAELAARLVGVSVFARVTPEHKLRIINAYKRRGEIVAMTGDGVNDAPPLVAADLGVAMGKIGTEVAKEAADIVLLEDNFGDIVSAIEEGRNMYLTIKKVILYLFSTSIGEVLVIVGALIAGYPLPLLAAQIIWLNFVTDGFLTVALAMEPKERGLLTRAFERPNKYMTDALMGWRMALMAVPMMLGTLVLFNDYFAADIEKAWTVALTTLAVFQWFNAWNCRSERLSILQMNPFSNLWLVWATVVVILLQLLAVYHPLFQSILRTVPLTLPEWLVIITISLSVVFVEEIRKIFHRIYAFRKMKLR